MICDTEGCTEARHPRNDRPGQFYPQCYKHFREQRSAQVRRHREEVKQGHVPKQYDPVKKPSATVEYQQRKNRESYHRHKTRPDRRIGPDLDARKEHRKQWYEANREAIRTAVRKYQQTPAGKAVARRSEYRRRGAAGHYTLAQWEARLAYYGFCCYLCGCDLLALPSVERTIDHVIPLARGGTNWPANLRPACRSCNCRKHTNYPPL